MFQTNTSTKHLDESGISPKDKICFFCTPKRPLTGENISAMDIDDSKQENNEISELPSKISKRNERMLNNRRQAATHLKNITIESNSVLACKAASALNRTSMLIEFNVNIKDLPTPTIMLVFDVKNLDADDYQTPCIISNNYMNKEKSCMRRVKSFVPSHVERLVEGVRFSKPSLLIYMGESATGERIFRAIEDCCTLEKTLTIHNTLLMKNMKQLEAYFNIIHRYDCLQGSVITFEQSSVIKDDEDDEERLTVRYRCRINNELMMETLFIPSHIATDITTRQTGIIIYKGLGGCDITKICQDVVTLTAHQALVLAKDLAPSDHIEFRSYFDIIENYYGKHIRKSAMRSLMLKTANMDQKKMRDLDG